MLDDWIEVTKTEAWAVGAAVGVSCGRVLGWFNPPGEFREVFPVLSDLLRRARRSKVTIDGAQHTLFAWGKAGHVRAWLEPPSEPLPEGQACRDHRLLLTAFGGIRERFNEPETSWLLNHNAALLAADASRDVSFIAHYAWAFEECGGIPIDMRAFYVVAWEANGNAVICSRETGELLFFAPDHANAELVPYGNCPMYTLHRHVQASTFRAWVEGIARQWLAYAG